MGRASMFTREFLHPGAHCQNVENHHVATLSFLFLNRHIGTSEADVHKKSSDMSNQPGLLFAGLGSTYFLLSSSHQVIVSEY